jgi:hypothetical protein
MGIPKMEKLRACEIEKYIYANKDALSPLLEVNASSAVWLSSPYFHFEGEGPISYPQCPAYLPLPANVDLPMMKGLFPGKTSRSALYVALRIWWPKRL